MFKIENGILSKEGYESTVSFERYMEIVKFVAGLQDERGIFSLEEAINNSPFPKGELHLVLDYWDCQNVLNRIESN